jgi:hypothetical protein
MKRMALNNMRQWQGWSLAKNITAPTLVITGERDSYFPRRVFEELARVIPGAEVYDVGSAKHKVQLERHTAVNRAIERFIEGKQHGSWRWFITARTFPGRCRSHASPCPNSWRARPIGYPGERRRFSTVRA